MTTRETDVAVEPVGTVESVGTVVEYPITPIASDPAPTPAAPTTPKEVVPVVPVVQSLDLTMPILEVLTSPNI